MKYLKTYENLNEPQIGDYCICYEERLDPNDNDNIILINFLKNNIGKIIRERDPNIDAINPNIHFFVQYENIPKELYIFFRFVNGRNDVRGMSKKEILKYSKNKKELEIFIDINKYNI